jgi:hypothetical protein
VDRSLPTHGKRQRQAPDVPYSCSD